MRAPRRKRPRRRKMSENISRGELERIAKQVTYTGSPEHKDTYSFVGLPHPRADASLCDKSLAREREKVQEWLRYAVLRGWIGEPWEGGFPRYVWYRGEDTVYEGRLINRDQGEYKGYPLSPEEWPEEWKG